MKLTNALKPWLMRFFNNELLRYIFIGGVNTILGYIIYSVFLLIVPYTIAYTTSYVAGIFISYTLTSLFVFHQHLSLRKAIQYPLIYIVQYILSITSLHIFVDLLHFDARFVPLIIIFYTVPVTYVLSRFIITKRKSAVQQ
jgi:putative flippase GtrA